jgi:hypothetical protein
VKAAFDRRVEVLNIIRRTPQQAGDTRPFPRETFGSALASMQGAPILQEGLDPEYKLTRNEVDAWMNSHKKKFYLLPAQVAIARVDKLDLRLSAYQRSQRQYNRFSGHGEEHLRWQEELAAVFG